MKVTKQKLVTKGPFTPSVSRNARDSVLFGNNWVNENRIASVMAASTLTPGVNGPLPLIFARYTGIGHRFIPGYIIYKKAS